MLELVESLSTPIMRVLMLMAFGLVLQRFRSRKRLALWGRLSAMAAAILLYLLSIPLPSGRLLYALECQHRPPQQELLSRLDLVTILGGGRQPAGEFREFPEPSGLTYARVIGGVKVFKQSQAATLGLCGDEARVMKTLAMELGVPQEKMIAETSSQNIMENAAEIRKLLAPGANRRIGLVTSALHMPRAERIFRQVFAEDTIIPLPVNYLNTPPERLLEAVIPSARALNAGTDVLHEWIGMIWYAIR
jgi:uncharacterized SAM-binding protein YcdF (DUF218 family)